MDKFYYDICIDYDPEHSEEGVTMRESKVEKTLFLEQPLLEQPGEYNLSVSKFSINTGALPVWIPELRDKQGPFDLIQNSITTDYVYYIEITYQTRAAANEPWDDARTYQATNYLELENFQANEIEKIGGMDGGYVHLNNLDKKCFVYDYNNLIYALNQTFDTVKDNFVRYIGINITENDESFAEYLLEDSLLRLLIHRDMFIEHDDVVINEIKIGFSENLYPLLGMGFMTKKMKFNLPPIDDPFYEDMKKRNYWCYVCDTIIAETCDFEHYLCIQQSFSTLLNWNPIKAIIIGTDTLPVVPEFLPIAHNDGHLTHYKNENYLNYLNFLGLKFNDQESDIFKRNSLKILDVYYPLTSSAGDIRSTCILSRDNIDQGQTIELLPSSPINRFNVWVKWLDLFGNLHDLYQYHGCCTDIRFCFTKKPVIKQDLVEGISNVVNSLAPPESKKQRKDPFLKQLADSMPRSNGKPDGIDIPGADNYGWIHL